ncbi:MAG TPA: type II toxin-antitoxin system death-on-curing family toxin [Gemmatimonadaceae bacterium]
MPMRRREPRWLTRQMVDAIHEAQLREHGGTPGVRDEALIESALARPRHKYAYARHRDRATLAAAYAFGLVKNHGFVDGNKRTAFMAAYVFLGLNGADLDATEAEVVVALEGVAAGGMTEAALAKWFRARI